MRRMIQRLNQLFNRIRILPARGRLHIVAGVRHLPQSPRLDLRQPTTEPPIGDIETATVRRRPQRERTKILHGPWFQQGDLIDELEAAAVRGDLDTPHLALSPFAMEDAAAI